MQIIFPDSIKDVKFMQKFSYMRQPNIPGTSPIYAARTSIVDMDTVRTKAVNGSRGFKRPDVTDIILFLLPFLAIFLWAISLQHVSVKDMNDLGLVSVLSPKIIAALGILVVSFTLTLQRREFRISFLALHLVFIILILNGTQNLIEEAPRFAVVYRLAGYTEYIMRTGTVNTNLDAYFSWPIFYVLNALVTKVSGYSTILSYAGWAPVFYSLIYFGPMYMIFESISTNKRLVWLSLLFFYLTNWIGQNYFSPQGLNFFLYLVIIAMLLKWFKIPPKLQNHVQLGQSSRQHLSFRQKCEEWLKASDLLFTILQPWQRRGLLCCLILIFGLMVSSHQLTPVFTLLSVGTLVIFRRCYPSWLPILMAAMIAAWLFFMAETFLAGHISMVTGNLGDVSSNLSTSTTARATVGDSQHQFVAKLRIIMTALIWFLAFLGCIKRMWQGHRDITCILLAVVGFLSIAAQNYGGEMFLRIYFFTLPFMVFFAAALFLGKPISVKHTISPLMTAAIIATNLILLSGFFFTCYGNERVDYITYAEWNGLQYLYRIAPFHSLLIQPVNSTPCQFKDFEKYDYELMTNTQFTDAIINADASPLVQFIESVNAPTSYVILTRTQQAQFTAYKGVSSNALQRLETALLKSGKFKLVYSNSDAQILQFIGRTQGGAS